MCFSLSWVKMDNESVLSGHTGHSEPPTSRLSKSNLNNLNNKVKIMPQQMKNILSTCICINCFHICICWNDMNISRALPTQLHLVRWPTTFQRATWGAFRFSNNSSQNWWLLKPTFEEGHRESWVRGSSEYGGLFGKLWGRAGSQKSILEQTQKILPYQYSWEHKTVPYQSIINSF